MFHLLHHANCADGFAAAVLAHHAFTRGTIHPGIRLQPVNYGWPQQAPDSVDITSGDHIFYLDYTPPWSVLESLRATWGTAVSVTVIDHHSTAQPTHTRLAQQPKDAFFYDSMFNLSQSGAALTWDYFFTGTPLPAGVRLIQHRDLGHAWQVPGEESEQAFDFHAALFRLLPRTVEAWTPALMDERVTSGLVRLGRQLRTVDRALLATAAEHPHWLSVNLALEGVAAADTVRIPAVNGLGPELNSDACNALLDRWPDAPFAAAWWVDSKTGRFTYSLRSRKTGPTSFNVAELAARLDPPRPGYNGGGGHPQAAGFSLPEALPMYLDYHLS